MSILFMTGEMSGLNPSDSTSYEDVNAGYNAGFARASVHAGHGSGTQFVATPEVAFTDDFYIHFEHSRPTFAAAANTVIALRTATTEVFRVVAAAVGVFGGTYQMQVWDGAAWDDIGSAISFTIAQVETIDLHITGNSATGTATWYISGTNRESVVADLSAVVGIETARFYGYDAFGQLYSQIIIADEPTIGMRLLTRYPNGAGSDTAWTGTYTDIDEAYYDDADFILSASANQVSTFAQTGPALTGYSVRAVGVCARARRGASGPQNLQLALRSAGTTYFSSTIALDVGYGGTCAIWETNPATSADWVSTAIAALQPGAKSIA